MRFVSLLLLLAATASAQVKITPETTRVRVEIDGRPFTDFFFFGGEAMKPFLSPLRAASGTIVTRQYPIESPPGEPHDHPHHRGLWFSHDNVNGIDFWNNETSYTSPPPRGRIAVNKIANVKNGAHDGSFSASLSWLDPLGNKLLEETRTFRFSSRSKVRIVDIEVALTAAAKVVFGDSKDGSLGIRLAPELQEDKNIKATKTEKAWTVPGPPGVIVNAEGLEHEKNVWGKPSNWVDYHGEIGGEKLGVAIFDHPANSRRARWHVRAYGLFAANPFGFSAFTNNKADNGSVRLEPGGALHFKYRVVIHEGDAKSAGIAKLWTEYAK
jgi:methane monooxygenase PmoA-like